MNETILFNSDSETAVQNVTAILNQEGYRVVRSFDLRSALATQPDYVCPCHGTKPCTCQFVVLLVYREAVGPVVVMVHGHNTETYLQIIHDPMVSPDPDLVMQVLAALIEANLTRPATTGVLATESPRAGDYADDRSRGATGASAVSGQN
jgi:hypothetical protein